MVTRKIHTVKFELAYKRAKREKAQVHAKNPQSGKDKSKSSKNENKLCDKRKGSDTTIATVDKSKLCNTEDDKGLNRGGAKWCPVHWTNKHDFDEYHVIKKKVDDKLKAAIAK